MMIKIKYIVKRLLINNDNTHRREALKGHTHSRKVLKCVVICTCTDVVSLIHTGDGSNKLMHTGEKPYMVESCMREAL